MNYKQLKAVLAFAAKNDVRPYLNAIHVDFDKKVVEATDGNALVQVVDHEGWLVGEGSVIIPREAVELAVKTKTSYIVITNKDICDVKYKPIEGGYPNFSRVLPIIGQTVNPQEHGFGVFSSKVMKAKEDLEKQFGRLCVSSVRDSGNFYGENADVKFLAACMRF